MTTPDPAEPAAGPRRLPPEPTIRVPRPPGPGPARSAQVAAGSRSAPVDQPRDEPTVGLPGPPPASRQRTLQFGRPTPVKVTVSARPRPRRRYRTWPWIAAVVLALLVLGVVLLVMLQRGATVDGDTELVGRGGPVASDSTAAVDASPSR